jgi:hypothetical protein
MRSLFTLVVVSLGSWAASPAAAHVLLDEPSRRYDDMKGAVCGKGGAGDARTSNFTRYAPGETITVRWTETINHVGSYRIAFDDDGADRGDFDANVLATIEDPSNDSGDTFDTEVTLPDVECTNCTLQLIQVMGQTGNDGNTYFQCADLVLGDGDGAPPGGCATSTSAPAALSVLLLLARRRRR